MAGTAKELRREAVRRRRLAGESPEQIARSLSRAEPARPVAEPTVLEDVVRAGAVVQLTAASIDGLLGRATVSCSHRLLEPELARHIATAAHGPLFRGSRRWQPFAALASTVCARGVRWP